jgi:hypothetical protein
MLRADGMADEEELHLAAAVDEDRLGLALRKSNASFGLKCFTRKRVSRAAAHVITAAFAGHDGAARSAECKVLKFKTLAARLLTSTPPMQPDRTAELIRLMRTRILIMDGAMGTMIQQHHLSESDFRGAGSCGLHGHARDLRGDNDLLVLTQPEVIRAIHDEYLEAGADVIETNTFSATSIAQADYGLEARAKEINFAAARIARECCDAWTARTPDKPRFVAGALGPTNRTRRFRRT